MSVANSKVQIVVSPPSEGDTNHGISLGQVKNVRRPTEPSGISNPEAQEGCPPSLSSLRRSVAKGIINTPLTRIFVPVVDFNQVPLMPTTPKHARKMVESGKATYFWKKGVFCIRLNVEPSGRHVDQIAVGIDPGSKMEGLTVKSAHHTFLNIQADAVTWVMEQLESRRDLRKSRRNRNTPCRQPRFNRSHRFFMPPSTRARWGWKLRLLSWLTKMFPISDVVVEDIKAKTKGQRRWDRSFSPLELGKHWFYGQIQECWNVHLTLYRGWETKGFRDALGLKKTKDKLAEKFSSHCVDSWVLANAITGGHIKPDNESILRVTPLRFHRRQLHRMVPSKGGKRSLYGGTRSLGLKRGSIVRHPKYGIVYVGGSSNNRISIHSLATGKRLSQNIKREDCKFLAYDDQRSYRC